MAAASRAVVNPIPCCGPIGPDRKLMGGQRLTPLISRTSLEDAISVSTVRHLVAGGGNGGNGGKGVQQFRVSAVASTEAAPQSKVSSGGGKSVDMHLCGAGR